LIIIKPHLTNKMSISLQQQVQQITALTNEEFEYFLSHFIQKKLKKHQYLIHEGDIVLNDYFVVKGCLKAYHTDKTGKEHILQFAIEDWWITDFQAYVYKTKATVNIACIEDCEVLALSDENREKLCAGFHKVEHFFRKKSNFGHVASQKRILSLLTNDAKERYNQFASSYPLLLQRLPKNLIAAYLGVSRETLSRLNKKM
jgi:CRP-like cAMP-binding protein